MGFVDLYASRAPRKFGTRPVSNEPKISMRPKHKDKPEGASIIYINKAAMEMAHFVVGDRVRILLDLERKEVLIRRSVGDEPGWRLFASSTSIGKCRATNVITTYIPQLKNWLDGQELTELFVKPDGLHVLLP